jgi:peptidase M28-like protein
MHRRARNHEAQPKTPAQEQQRFDARKTLEAIARPRLTGTEGSVEVIAELSRRFEAYGYEVTTSRFRISTWPGRFGVSLAGAVYLIAAIMATRMLSLGHPGIALVLLLLAGLIIGAIAVLAKPAIAMLPVGRVQGVNLLAHVPGSRPRYYFVAHHDSKSQPVPLAFRGPAIILGALTWLVLTTMATAALIDPIWGSAGIVPTLGMIAIGSGAILTLCWVDNRSDGALDNGSGVATLLGLAEQEIAAGDVAFIVTDAEELGLCGARAIARQLPPAFGVINVDGIDDVGDFYVMERFGWRKKRGTAPHLAAAILQAADALKLRVHRRDVPLGLLLDHIPLVQAGIPALTLMRGKLASLRRVHRPADNLDYLSGSGVMEAVRLLADTVELLRRQK